MFSFRFGRGLKKPFSFWKEGMSKRKRSQFADFEEEDTFDDVEEKRLEIKINEGKTKLRCKWVHMKGIRPEESDTPIVLLHGALGNEKSWKKFPEQLCVTTSNPVFVYERQGYEGDVGFLRSLGKDYLWHYSCVELPQLLKSAGFGAPGGLKPPMLVGHSDGATIALWYAIHAQKSADLSPQGIVAISPHTFIEEETTLGVTRWAIKRREELVKKVEKHFEPKIAAELVQWFGEAWGEGGFMHQFDIRKLLPSIFRPVIVLQGEFDQYGTSAQVDELVSRCSGYVSSTIFPDATHHPHVEMEDQVLAEILHFNEMLKSGVIDQAFDNLGQAIPESMRERLRKKVDELQEKEDKEFEALLEEHDFNVEGDFDEFMRKKQAEFVERRRVKEEREKKEQEGQKVSVAQQMSLHKPKKNNKAEKKDKQISSEKKGGKGEKKGKEKTSRKEKSVK